MNAVVMFEPVTHPLQWLVAGYQLITGRKNWQSVHTILFVKRDGHWLRIELGWDGLSVLLTDGFPEENFRDYQWANLSSDGWQRLWLVMDMFDVLGDRLRYVPWSSIPLVYGKPSWFTCSSMVSFILYGTLVDEPGLLHDIIGGTLL